MTMPKVQGEILKFVLKRKGVAMSLWHAKFQHQEFDVELFLFVLKMILFYLNENRNENVLKLYLVMLLERLIWILKK